MGLKTRKKTSKKKGICSIPELRRSFEYIEQYVDNKIDANETKERIVSSLRKEWEKVFFKNLDKKSADAFVKDRLHVKHKAPRTLRRKGQKGGGPIAGAPLDYVTRPGIYLEQGQIPSSQSFGSYIPYVDKGFWNPMPGRSFDPLIGQQRFPTTTPVGMGSNVFKGGKRRMRRVRRGGAIPAQVSSVGSFLSEAYNHPISSSSPPTALQDMQSMWYGTNLRGENPDQVQRSPSYRSM